MSDLFNQEQLNIKQVFNKFYQVPDYQREYVWTERNVKALLSDINENRENGNEPYFLGTMVLSKKGGDSWEVIDGQQRLTTLFLIVCILKNIIQVTDTIEELRGYIFSSNTDEKGQSSKKYRLFLNYEYAENIIDQIAKANNYQELETKVKNDWGKQVPFTIKTLLKAYKTINDFFLEEIVEGEEIKKFIGYFLNNVLLLQISTDIKRALVIFETINERGVGLSPIDLIKNSLFRKVEKREEFRVIKNKWDNIFQKIEKDKERLRFLRYYIMANFPKELANDKAKYKNGILRENDIFSFVSNLSEISNPGLFLKDLDNASKMYISFINSKDKDGKDNINLRNIQKMSGSLSTYQIVLLAAKKLPEEIFSHFLMQLESYMFFYIFSKKNANALEREFASWVQPIKDISDLEDEIKRKIKYNEFLIANLRKPVLDNMKSFEAVFGTLSLRNFKKNSIRFFLNKVSCFIQSQWNGAECAANLFEKLQIEHILPDNALPEVQDAYKDEYMEYKSKLGNLTLLEAPINYSLGNNFYDIKKIKYEKSSCYFTKSISKVEEIGKENTKSAALKELLKSWNVWDKKSIDDRQQNLLNLAEKIWQIKELE